MDDVTRARIAQCLEHLADQQTWDAEVWQRCYDLVRENMNEELLAYVHDDVIHYNGAFHSRNVLGFRANPNRFELEDYRLEFRNIAAALRVRLSLADAKKTYGL